MLFGSTAATSFTVTSATSITAVDPAEALGTVDVKVTNAAGTSATSPADQFVYTLPVYIVTSADGNLADGSATDVTLPWAVSQGPDIIEFAASLSGDTITLSGNLSITSNVDIVGLGANELAVSGGGLVRDFTVSSGVTATISGLTIEDGNAAIAGSGHATGGGIFNSGTLTLANDAVSENNSNVQYGIAGGIYNSGTLTIYDSTIDKNSASGRYGGGIYNDTTGTLSVVNSTITGNEAYFDGGGIDNQGKLNLTNSTVTGNGGSYSSGPGGIAAGGTVTMVNTIVAYNTSNDGPADIGGNVKAYNSLIGNTSGVTITDSSNTTNILGTSADLAGSLANNGGPTQTIALLRTSPAFEAGGAITTVTTSASVGATTLSVGNAAAIASTPGQYYIVIDGAELEVTGVNLSTNTLTLATGTTAAINSGDKVYLFSDQRGVVRKTTPDIGAYEYAIGVNQNTGNLPITATTILISGSLFDPNMANDTVTFNQTVDPGVTGTVIYATANYLGVSLSGLNSSLIGKALDVAVSADGISSASVQVATISAAATIPSVTFSGTVPDSSVTLTIDGTNFDTTNPANNTVIFTSLGVTGTVTAVNAAGTQLTVTISTSPTGLGALYASVTIDGISSGSPVDVATIASGNWIVTTSAITGGSPSNVTLPYAVAYAQNGDTITFANHLTGGNTITLASTLTLDNSVAITDQAQNVTVSGNNAVQAFSVGPAATVSITGLIIENGMASGSGGGGINNAGTLTLTKDTVSNNGAGYAGNANGGGIYNSGALTIYDSTVNNNQCVSNGGGIYNASSGTLSIANSTVYGNSFYTYGGGIYNSGLLNLSNSTITGNTGVLYNGNIYGNAGGGIYNSSQGTVKLRNTIVAGNGIDGGSNYTNSGGPDIYGSVTAYNSLIGNTTNVTITNSSNTTNILGSSAGLATSLANNGGPTQTVALLPGSPALNTGGAVTTIAAGHAVGLTDTTIYVQNAAAIAATSGGYLILIGQEEMLVTNVNTTTNTLTVERGVDGTTAATQLAGANVYLATDQRGYQVTTPPDIGAYQATSFDVFTTPTATPDGFVLRFSEPINPATTVLYSSPGDTTLGSADVTVTGPNGNVRGSLIIDPTYPNEATFVATSGLLASGTYTITVTSAVKASGGDVMSGNYTATVSVTAPTTPVLSVPSFARGPGQPVALTDSLNNTTGIPISISSATNVTQVSFSLTYDPQLLTIAGSGALSLSSAATTAGLVIQGYTITRVDAYHSILNVSISGGTGFTPANGGPLVTILASVPTTAPYLDKEVLNLSNVLVNSATATGFRVWPWWPTQATSSAAVCPTPRMRRWSTRWDRVPAPASARSRIWILSLSASVERVAVCS